MLKAHTRTCQAESKPEMMTTSRQSKSHSPLCKALAGTRHKPTPSAAPEPPSARPRPSAALGVIHPILNHPILKHWQHRSPCAQSISPHCLQGDKGCLSRSDWKPPSPSGRAGDETHCLFCITRIILQSWITATGQLILTTASGHCGGPQDWAGSEPSSPHTRLRACDQNIQA